MKSNHKRLPIELRFFQATTEFKIVKNICSTSIISKENAHQNTSSLPCMSSKHHRFFLKPVYVDLVCYA